MSQPSRCVIKLLNELVEAADEKQLNKTIARYGRVDLLCIDELGYCGPSSMDVPMAAVTDHEGLASALRHEPCPERGFRPTRPVEICHFTDVVVLQILPRPADLALPRQEPVDQLVAAGVSR